MNTLLANYVGPFIQGIQGIETQTEISSSVIQNAVSNAVTDGLSAYNDLLTATPLSLDELASGAAQVAATAVTDEFATLSAELEALLSGNYALAPPLGIGEVEGILLELKQSLLSSILELDSMEPLIL